MEVIAFGALIVSPFMMLAFALFWWMKASARSDADIVWQTYAEQRHLTFVPASGEWPNRASASIAWDEGETSCYVVGSSDEAAPSITLVARPSRVTPGTFTLRPRAQGRTVDPIGDPLVDSRFEVQATPRDFVHVILTPGVKRALVAFDIGPRGSLTLARGDIELSWSSREAGAPRLDEARALMRQVVQALGAATEPDGVVPRSRPLQGQAAL